MVDSNSSGFERPIIGKPCFSGTSTDCKCASSLYSIESVSSGFVNPPELDFKIVDYKKAKSILQEQSSNTGENLLDHLIEIIERIIIERPTNVIDYFEEYSRDVRVHKYRLPEDLTTPYQEPQFLKLAKAVISILMPPSLLEDIVYGEENLPVFGESEMTVYQSLDSSIVKIPKTLTSNKYVFQLQHLWAFCGLGFQIDEVFQLAWAIQKVQLYPPVKSARFWGRIYGLNCSYYVVEAELTKTEIDIRLLRMKSELMNKMIAFIDRKNKSTSFNYSNLIPGHSWQNRAMEELKKMKGLPAPIPELQIEEKFDMPPEPVGSGLNQRTYFVTTSLSEDWQELPVVTPKQIAASKKIQKYFTGNLDTNIACYPFFPGTEKHYLRAMIARITSGTYIAPQGYYRKLTKKEIRLRSREVTEVVVEEEEYDSEGEEQDFDNDALIMENSDYKQISFAELTSPSNWVHVRSNILDQGRVYYIDEELAINDIERKALQFMKGVEAVEEGGEEEQSELGGDYAEESNETVPETGPPLFSTCNIDKNICLSSCWTSRYSSIHDTTNQMMLMRSNLWPGAYSFTFDNFCDSIYIGWGLKYVARCCFLQNLPGIKNIDHADVACEVTDPSVEMEEKWRLYNVRDDAAAISEMSDISVEFDFDDEEDKYN